jgi:NO-binding membrane sensor protein with MHYT domain
MPSGESSLLLWLMAIVVTLLGAHIFIAWVRRAQGPGSWRAATLAGVAMGLGLTCSMLLTMSAEALPFPLGYRWLLVPALWLLPLALCVPLAWWLMRRRDWLTLVVCSLLLTAIAIAVQAGWVVAAGLRPGLRWNFVWVSAAVAVQILGFLAGLWMAFSDASSDGDRKTLWRAGAAALIVLSVVAGQECMVSAVNLLTQVGSIYQREASSTWLCLIAGALVPIMMGMAALDIWLRNRVDRQNRRSKSTFGTELNMPQRRKRRRKYRPI